MLPWTRFTLPLVQPFYAVEWQARRGNGGKLVANEGRSTVISVTTPEGRPSTDTGSAYRILLVADDPFLRKLGGVQLRAAGFFVQTASNAAEAIDFVRNGTFDAVVCDVVMRDLDGFGFCRRLRADPSLPRTPVILISAHYEGLEAGELAKTVGASALVLRTTDFGGEIETLRRALEERAPDRSARPGSDSPRSARQATQRGGDSVAYEEHLRVNANQLRELVSRTESAEKRYRALFENASDTITLLTPEGIILEANRRWADVLDIAPEQLVGRHMRDFAPPGHEQTSAVEFQTALANGGSQNPVLLCRRDGSIIHMEFSTTLLETDGQRFVCAIGRDVTERVMTAKRLEAAEKRYRMIVERMPDAVWTADEHGTITYVSPNFARVAGLLPGEDGSLDMSVAAERILPREVESMQKAFGELLRDGKAFHVDYRCRRHDGGWVWLRNRGASTYDRDGVKYAEGVLSDVTEQHALEERLRHAQKMDAVGRLAGGVAHDFNNMLNVILGQAWTLLEGLSPNHSMHQPLSEIKRAAERSAHLTRPLLAFSRQIPQSIQVIDLNEAVIDAWDLARRDTGDPIEVVCRLAAEPCPVEIDPGQLDQILTNLVVNAREAMPHGGVLTFKTRVVTQGAERSATKGRQFALLTIADTGIGMDSQTRVRIFEPFFTTKQHGTGLGLSIVFGIVQGCDGHIDVDSEPRKGTTIKIRLPLARKVLLASKS